MNLVVTVKYVPDPNIPPVLLAVDADGKRIVVPPGIAGMMNGYDANALEAAVRLREQHGGAITAVSVGGEGARDTVRQAIAAGASAGVHVHEANGADLDSAATAELLAAAICRLGPVDLVLCGRQASDTDAGQVLFRLAERLDLPAVSPVKAIVAIEDTELIVERIAEEGTQRVRVRLPAVLGVSSEANQPRYPSLKGVMVARRAQIPAWSRTELGVDDLARRVEVRRLSIPVRQRQVELIPGASPGEIGGRLADTLREAGLI